MRTRRERRYLTKRYQKRQIRLFKEYFLYESEDYLNDERKGSFRTRSWKDCGGSCSMCGNPRKHGWETSRGRLTFPERKALDSFNDIYKEYFKD